MRGGGWAGYGLDGEWCIVCNSGYMGKCFCVQVHETRICEEVMYRSCVVTLRGAEWEMHATWDVCRMRFTL